MSTRPILEHGSRRGCTLTQTHGGGERRTRREEEEDIQRSVQCLLSMTPLLCHVGNAYHGRRSAMPVIVTHPEPGNGEGGVQVLALPRGAGGAAGARPGSAWSYHLLG
jgi:hypothetical protein